MTVWFVIVATIAVVSFSINIALIVWVVTRESLYRMIMSVARESGQALFEVKQVLTGMREMAVEERREDREACIEIKAISTKIDAVLMMAQRSGVHIDATNVHQIQAGDHNAQN